MIEKRKKKMQMMSFINFFLLILFNICSSGTYAQDERCFFDSSDILNKAPSFYDIREPYDIDSFIRDETTFLDSIQFSSLYQIDTLVSNYQKGNDFVYVIGSKCFSKYSELYLLRIYGNWLKTIELLTYDNNGSLKGYLILESKGGEHDFTLRASSKFLTDTLVERINIVKIYEDNIGGNTKCVQQDSTYSKFAIDKTGIISLIEDREFTNKCDE